MKWAHTTYDNSQHLLATTQEKSKQWRLRAYIWSRTSRKRIGKATAWIILLYYVSTVGHTPLFRWFDHNIQTRVSNTSSSQAVNKVQWPLTRRSLRGFEELEQGTSPTRAQYFRKKELSIYSSRWVLTVLLSAGDGITSLLCCNGYQRYPAAFMFSEGRAFRRTLTQPSDCHGDNSKNIYFQGKPIFFVTCCKLTSCKVTLMWGVSWSITTSVRE
jgi:hypothetical protein